MRKLGILCAMGFLLFSVCSCAPKEGPADFAAQLAEDFSENSEQAIAAYQGKSCRIAGSVLRVDREGYVQMDCGRDVSAWVYLPQEELEKLELCDVLRIEGTVKQIAERNVTPKAPRIEIDPVKGVETEFEVTGQIGKIYHDWYRGGQDYAAFFSDEVLPGCQVNIYLPEDHGFQEGDRITAVGALDALKDGRVTGYVPGGERKELLFMDEPTSLQKAPS